MDSSFLSKLILHVIGEYLFDPIAPFGQLHLLQSIAHFVFKSVFSFGASTISYDPIRELLDATRLNVDNIALNLMLIKNEPSFLKLLALDYRHQTVSLGLQNVVKHASLKLVPVDFLVLVLFILVENARTAEEARYVLVDFLLAGLHRRRFQIGDVGSLVELSALLVQPKVALTFRLLKDEPIMLFRREHVCASQLIINIDYLIFPLSWLRCIRQNMLKLRMVMF